MEGLIEIWLGVKGERSNEDRAINLCKPSVLSPGPILAPTPPGRAGWFMAEGGAIVATRP
jgi:hypothetical protein